MALLLRFLLGRLSSASRQNKGEAAVRRVLSSSAHNRRYHLLNNVTLPYQDGTTQIDHVLVSRAGVFVIEAKHYTGWIFGDAQSPQWTQVIYQTKHRFQNPIHQNAKHVRAIRELLDFLPPEQVHSVVVFTGDAEFKTAMPGGVLPLSKLIAHLKSFGDEVMSENRMQFCVGRLECTRRALTGQTDIEHQAYLDRKFGRAI